MNKNYAPLISFFISIWLQQYSCTEATGATTTTTTTTQVDRDSILSYTHLNKQLNKLVDYLHIYGCTPIVLFGCTGNLISFLVFMRAGRRSPKIITRNTFIILTITNTSYLILYWYLSIYPKMRSYYFYAFASNGVAHSPSLNVSQINDVGGGSHNGTQQQGTAAKNQLLNTNLYFCKLIMYLVNVTSYLNSSITVLFSVERALAINFPFKIRALREKKLSLFRMVLLVNVVLSFALPSYNLLLIELNATRTLCDVPDKYQLIYFVLTVLFVVAILAIPFLLITVSNVSIVMAIYRNKQKREYYLTERVSDAGSITSKTTTAARRRHSSKQMPNPNQHHQQQQNKCHELLYYKTMAIKSVGRKASTLSNISSRTTPPTSRSTVHKPSLDGLSFARGMSTTSASASASASARPNGSIGGVGGRDSLVSACAAERKLADADVDVEVEARLIQAARLNGDQLVNGFQMCINNNNNNNNKKREMSVSYKYPKDKNLRVTKMLFAISASFMLLNFPHFIAWTRYALYRLANHGQMDTNELVRATTAYLYNIIKLTETLSILNYSITSLLYFASGKIYRDHLYSMFDCKVNSYSSTGSASLILVQKSSNRFKSLAD
jgi:hypothetical protein